MTWFDTPPGRKDGRRSCSLMRAAFSRERKDTIDENCQLQNLWCRNKILRSVPRCRRTGNPQTARTTETETGQEFSGERADREGETRGREISRCVPHIIPLYPYPSSYQLGPVTVQYSDARLGVEPACEEQELDGTLTVEYEEEEQKAGSTSPSTREGGTTRNERQKPTFCYNLSEK